jgi:hypothetical protein
MPKILRCALATRMAFWTLLPVAAYSADALKEIDADLATYDAISICCKQKGLLEKEFEGRHQHRLGAVAGVQQGAGYRCSIASGWC